MMDWIMKRFGASVEELAQEAYEELLGYQGTHDEIPVGQRRHYKPGQGGHKPMRHDIQKLKELTELSEASRFTYNDQGGDPSGPGQYNDAGEQWRKLVEMNDEEARVARVYEEVKDEPGWFEGKEDTDPFQATLDVLTGRFTYWEDVLDLALRSNTYGPLPYHSEEEARKLLSSALRKQQIAQAPKIWNGIQRGLNWLKEEHPESYKLWPWYVKQVKKMYTNNTNASGQGLAGSAYTHWAQVVGNAGEQIAQLRRENKLPQNFDINKMDIDDLEQWHMDYKRQTRQAEDQGEVVYQWDDGWTMQRLTDEAQLQYEGDTMGHCVGDYGHHVDSGQSIIYSLRDPKGTPHVTIEMEGPELLKQLHDKPMSEFDGEDVTQLELGKKMRRGEVYPTPLFENGQDLQEYQQYTGMGKDNRWPNYLTERNRVTPHDIDPDTKYYNKQGVPWDNSFYVVQVQGNSNTTPKPEYQKRVKEFMDYLKSKGFTFQRSDEWYAPYDARDNEELDGYDNFSEWADRQNRYDYNDSALGWYEHYRAYPEVYGVGDGEDEYGIKRDRKYSGYAPGVVQDTLEHVLEQGEDPAYAAQALMHWAMSENMAYADMDDAVRSAENWMHNESLADQERAWETDNGTWMVYNEETGQDEEHEGGDLPDDAYFLVTDLLLDVGDPKYSDGYKFINALDQYLAWYYDNKKQADADRHPSMKIPRLKWTGDNIPDGFIDGTDPYGPTPEQQAQADQQAQQDAGSGFSTMNLNGVFSSIRTAEKEHDPDYMFVYYMSELRVEPWGHNGSFEEIFEQLLDEFNVDLGNSLMDINPADVAAGHIRIRKGKPEIDHHQLCPPEIREQAETAIKEWWAKQWFEALSEDWYSVDERHTLSHGPAKNNEIRES